MNKINIASAIKSALFGVAIGDALGVPVEFVSRKILKDNPISDMIGMGTYKQPAGTWSDDSSLTFCLVEALTQKYEIKLIANNFVWWLNDNYWTARGSVFDVGFSTLKAITRLAEGVEPELAGGTDEHSNGNGSLMRILPLLFYIIDKPINERFSITKQVSSITHGHIRSVIACFYYLEFARLILDGKDKFDIYKILQNEIYNYLNEILINQCEISKFERLLKEDIFTFSEEMIFSSGYVLHTLEASIWCILTTNSYEDAVLKAVNLGEDTDTTAAVTGGLAGLVYGFESIPERWLEIIARYEDIEKLAEKFACKISTKMI